MRKIQTQGVHHITLVGADRQTSIDFWEGVLGMPFVFEQPNLDNEAESHLYFDPGDGRLITVFTDEGRERGGTTTVKEPGRVHHLAFNVSQATFRQTVERLDERGIHHSGVKDRGFMDSIYFARPARAAGRARVLPIRAAVGLHACRGAARGAQAARRARRLQHRAGAPRRRDRGVGHAIARVTVRGSRSEGSLPSREEHMAANKLNILEPSVNNMCVRVFVRAAGLDFEEENVWGQTTGPEYLAKYPVHLTPTLEEEGLPKGTLGESCAIMAYLCNKHGLTQFYPADPGERAMVDNAMFYLIGTFYPLLTRATYPTLQFPQYAGEVGTSEADAEMKAKAQKDAEAALADPLEAFRSFFLDDRKFVGGDEPSIADLRWVATLEFLRAIDYDFPAWTEDYMRRVEEALGEAYTGPAQDVRGYIASVKPAEQPAS